ncbi:hypothetical protein S40285_05004 [Stachybotrys chlorohalonatus IBT 40285]|uniref:inorganic diphosphatase n=1 Tax=Stachybotrys chlorohalonatus (strain IBT 40285) TaxID=1283841 RepID=A0A084QRW2_STAC4|nr:hypothetical protein S40285_05004 [Stachybotrys chlorohalonata IBT 40285]
MLSVRALVLALAAVASAAEDVFDPSAYSLREVGARNTLDWRIWLEKDGHPVSPWHDIPLHPFPNDTAIINYYIEIPRWTDGKVETKRDEPLNPIFHDDRRGQPRFVATVWPHKTYPFHYGSIPQTWEDSTVTHNFTGYPGDNDPMDVFDITSIGEGYVGEIRQAKVLGGLPMIDDEATDWKVIVIDINDPLAALVDTVADLEQYRPGLAQSMHDWFIYYKVLRGSGLNTIVNNGYVDAPAMHHHIAESHSFWQNLVRGVTQVEEISTNQTSHPAWCRSYVPADQTTELFDVPAQSNILPAAERPSRYDRWYYLDADFQPIDVPGEIIDVD